VSTIGRLYFVGALLAGGIIKIYVGGVSTLLPFPVRFPLLAGIGCLECGSPDVL
jgi:hypothetical protein